MPSWLSMSFQDSGSVFMSELSNFHDYVIVVMSGIIVLITYVIIMILVSSKYYKSFSEGTFIETVWSVVPAFLLVVLVLPSMKVLYLMEDIKFSFVTYKVVGHQWYWSYVVPLYKNLAFKFYTVVLDSYEFDSMLEGDYPRLLKCSESLCVPVNQVSRLLVSSADVIHSFAVPSLGLKVDALPGRINQLFLNPSRLGVYYGQCSEICGSNHSFMPISLKVMTLEDYDFEGKLFLLEAFSDYGVADFVQF